MTACSSVDVDRPPVRRYNGMSIEILNPSGGGGVVVRTGRCPDADGAVLALTSTRLQVGGASSFVSGAVPVLASAFLLLTARDAEGAAKTSSIVPGESLLRAGLPWTLTPQ